MALKTVLLASRGATSKKYQIFKLIVSDSKLRDLSPINTTQYTYCNYGKTQNAKKRV